MLLLSTHPTAIDSDSIEPLSVLNSKLKFELNVAYLKIIIFFPSIKIFLLLFYLMQLFSADATIKKEIYIYIYIYINFALKSCSVKLKSTFFSLLLAQPKWPKQRNSCSKMWPTDQLHIELGYT